MVENIKKYEPRDYYFDGNTEHTKKREIFTHDYVFVGLFFKYSVNKIKNFIQFIQRKLNEWR